MEPLPFGRGAHPTAPEGGRGPREGGFRLCAADGDVGVPSGGKWKKYEGRSGKEKSACGVPIAIGRCHFESVTICNGLVALFLVLNLPNSRGLKSGLQSFSQRPINSMVLRLHIQLSKTAKGSCVLRYRAISVRETKSEALWATTVTACP